MATVIHINDGPTGYKTVVDTVARDGVRRSPRGIPTRDLGFTTIVIADPTRAYPLGTGRNLSHRIAAAESVQLIGAFSDPTLLPKAFSPYQEDDGRFWGAYGDRIGYQMCDVVRKLTVDRDTRQAIISLWNPLLDNAPSRRDYPCTLTLGFSISNGALDMNVVMRSNDVWLGTPYDWCQFSVMQMTVARLTSLPVGTYRHTALSLHIYESDVSKIDALHDEPEARDEHAFPRGLARHGDRPFDTIQRCRRLPYDTTSAWFAFEHWYRDAICD